MCLNLKESSYDIERWNEKIKYSVIVQFFIHFSKIVKVHYFVREVVMSKYVTQTAVPGARNSSSVALLLLLGV